MKISTKLLVAAASAASIVSFALPASAVVYIGLQTAGVNLGAITNEASGANFATFVVTDLFAHLLNHDQKSST